MTAQTYILVLVVGASLIAIWLESRFQEVAPQTIGRAIGHVVAGAVLLELAPFGMRFVLAGGGNPSRLMFALFLVLMPALVYAFVAMLWLMRRCWGSTAHFR